MKERVVFVSDRRRRVSYTVDGNKITVLSDEAFTARRPPGSKLVLNDHDLDLEQAGLYQALLDYLKKKRVEHLKNGGHDRGYEP